MVIFNAVYETMGEAQSREAFGHDHIIAYDSEAFYATTGDAFFDTEVKPGREISCREDHGSTESVRNLRTMTDHENAWDKLLRIKTTGRDESNADEYHHPYEPTPYSVLERLAGSGLIGKDDTVLDYGCGKGRVGFFLSYRMKAKTIGIEYDDRIYESALDNRKTAVPQAKSDFVLTRAEEYELPPDVNRCYFFNPFSAEILHKVMARIIGSYYEHPREMFLFFYYPSDEFISYLMTVDELEFYDEIECEDLFDGKDMRERIMIFQLPDYENGD